MKSNTPWVTIGILVINIVMFVVMSVMSWHQYTALWHWLLISNDAQTTQINLGALTPTLVWVQPWRLFTYMWLHNSVLHITLNMLALFTAASVERRYGWKLFIVLYVVSGILAGVAGALLIGLLHVGFLVGASGALYGVIVADETYKFMQQKNTKKRLVYLVSVYAAGMVVGNFFAHVLGGLTGMAFALILLHREG